MFMSNASHFIQPCDDNIFTNFKFTLAAEARTMIEETSRRNIPFENMLVKAAPIAEAKAFS